MKLESEESTTWQLIEFVGLPKERNAINLKQYRWIGKLSCFLKCYLQSLRPSYIQQMKPSNVNIFGFRAGKFTEDLTAVLKELLHQSTTWSKRLYISSQDVETALDFMVNLQTRCGGEDCIHVAF